MKKKIVEVDEDVLKEIIVGDIPVFGKDSPAPKEKSVEHQEAKSPAATVPADTPAEKPSVEKPKRKKKNTPTSVVMTSVTGNVNDTSGREREGSSRR